MLSHFFCKEAKNEDSEIKEISQFLNQKCTAIIDTITEYEKSDTCLEFFFRKLVTNKVRNSVL
jgi:hypothetical protein